MTSDPAMSDGTVVGYVIQARFDHQTFPALMSFGYPFQNLMVSRSHTTPVNDSISRGEKEFEEPAGDRHGGAGGGFKKALLPAGKDSHGFDWL